MKKFLTIFSNSSLNKKLLVAFVVTSIIPTFFIVMLSYANAAHIVRDHARELNHEKLQQIRSSLDVWVDSYEDILFQIYMNDDIVDMVEDINDGKDIVTTTARLRRILRGMFYTKEHIKSITVITESGEVVFYDLLTGKTTQNSWMDNVGMSKSEIYDYLSKDNDTSVISTKKAGVFAAETYYLFHLGHRIINYKNVAKQLGVVVISVDETMLREICGNEGNPNGFTFLVDSTGNMVSCDDKELLGKKIITWTDDINDRRKAYIDYLLENHFIEKTAFVDVAYDESFGVDIINVSNQKLLFDKLKSQQQMMMFVLCLVTAILIGVIVTLTKNLMSSINSLVEVMKIAEEGTLSIRAADKKSPTEIRIIETQFNTMMEKLEYSLVREKEAVERQKDAEIKALEAQINPHFLYNTLDTINWMAIDKEEYEISKSITALATILRYGIDNSNAIVNVGREVEWLKQYLFLQQTRLKNSFECEINVASEVIGVKIHKLLFQPFVENAILHGYEAKKGVHLLKIEIFLQDEKLRIQIWDNGIGMPQELIRQINEGIYLQNSKKNCIGMENAITRIKMYYGEEAYVKVESEIGEYTCVQLCLPVKEEI